MKTLRKMIDDQIFVEMKERNKQKQSFWCTESEKNQLEIFLAWNNVPKTNPMEARTQFGLNIRTKVEDIIVGYLDNVGVIVAPEDYVDLDGTVFENPDQHRVQMIREGVPITGYMDAVIMEDGVKVPVEVKTSYGFYGEKELEAGTPKTTYIKQIAQYMDSMDAKKGYLFQVHFSDNGFIPKKFYQFVVTREGNTFTCGDYSFDIYEDVYKRYARIYNDYIVPNVEPKSEFVYKHNLEAINWMEMPASKIGNARTNKAVIGDWQMIYSDWKDLMIEKEGTCLGYSTEELAYINVATKGYSGKNWREQYPINMEILRNEKKLKNG